MSLLRNLATGMLLAAGVGIAPAAETTGTTTHPNVLIVFTDDLGYGDISAFASKPLKTRTPHLDQLAREGMKFTQFYVNMPICSPSRASLITSIFAPETGLTTFLQARQGNRAADQNDYLDPALSRLPTGFKAAGYATAHVGKWHMGGGRDVHNAPGIDKYGYDEFWSTWESPKPDPKLGSHVPSWSANKPATQLKRWKTTGYMVDKALDFMKRHKGTPCFVMLCPEDIHSPFIPAPRLRKKHNAALNKPRSFENMQAVLENFDAEMGRLSKGLKQLGLEDSTIVVFTGDNGPNPDFNGRRTDGLRGAKASLYEGGIREPFIIRWPGRIAAGSENNDTVLSSVDLYPSLAALAGIPVDPAVKAKIDGEDLSAAFLGKKVARTGPLLFEFGRMRKPSLTPNERRSPTLAIREGDYKLLLNHDGSGAELYNIPADRYEKTNIADKQTTVVAELKKKVLEWSKTLPHRTHP